MFSQHPLKDVSAALDFTLLVASAEYAMLELNTMELIAFATLAISEIEINASNAMDLVIHAQDQKQINANHALMFLLSSKMVTALKILHATLAFI